MYAEVEKFITTLAAIETTERDDLREAESAYREHGDYELNRSARGVAAGVRRVATKNAWAELAKSSEPLVAWIADNCTEYPDHARQVLEALPASLADLRQLARDNDWCGTWDHFVNRAAADGAFPFATVDDQRDAILSWFESNYGDRTETRMLRTMLDGLIGKARETETPAKGDKQ